MIFKKLTVKYFCGSEPLNIHMSPDTSTNIIERGQKQFRTVLKAGTIRTLSYKNLKKSKVQFFKMMLFF